MESYRIKGLNVLSNVISKNKNVNIIERKIYEFSIVSSTCTDIIRYYNDTLVEVYMKLKQNKNLIEIFRTLSEQQMDWNDVKFNDCKKKIEEYDMFIEKPFEIEDGVIECNKCGSKQTYSYTKQTRSGDEATTVFSVCARCNAKWKT